MDSNGSIEGDSIIMTILDQQLAHLHRKNLRKIVDKINYGEMLSLDEVNDAIYILGCLVDDLITLVLSWKNVVEGMVAKQ